MIHHLSESEHDKNIQVIQCIYFDFLSEKIEYLVDYKNSLSVQRFFIGKLNGQVAIVQL